MNKFNTDALVGIIGITAGLVGIGYALGTHSKMTKISENLERSIDDLASETPVDIPKDMVERAVEKAVAAKVEESVKKATDDVKYILKADIHKQVSDAVESEYDKIKETVLTELTAEAAKIDVKRVRHDVEKAAKEKALDTFDENLNDILEDFTENLSNTRKIYEKFANAATPSSRETILRIG